MTLQLHDGTEPVSPTPDDTLKARAAVEALASHAQLSLCAGEDRIEVPRAVFDLVKSILLVMAEGHAVSIMPCTMRLTTQQAAEFLNVSRPFVRDLLDRGELPYEMVGSHRRILLKDLLHFRKRHQHEHEEAMDFLSEQTQSLGFEEVGLDTQ